MPAAPTVVAALAARCRFPAPGTPVTCAVSGGADSLALLVLAVDAGCQVTAVHVDHGLRAGSAAEADVVRSAAARLGAAFRSAVVDVPPGPNLEARARAARYAVLPPDVLTGHTADDLAETIVLNLVRGAGLDGLAAMARSGARSGAHSGPVRPLLGLRRHETRALCAAVGLVPVEDPMNADPAYRRVRVRREALPLLADIADRDVVEVIARQAALLADDAALLDDLAAAIDPSDARALRAAPLPLARRAVRRWMAAAGYGRGDPEDPDGPGSPATDPAAGRWAGAGHPPGVAVVERVLAVAAGTARGADLTDGWRVTRSRGRLELLPPGQMASRPRAAATTAATAPAAPPATPGTAQPTTGVSSE